MIIPVLDDRRRLETCLDALDRQLFELRYEILVVDNGSSDDPAGAVEQRANARLLHEPRRSSYAARNVGVREARGEVLAFTDADCIPAPDWLERGYARVKALTEPAFVTGQVDVFPHKPGAPTLAERYDMLHGFDQKMFVESLHFGVTANLFVTQEVFVHVGNFSDELVSSGDREWGQRAGDQGVAAVYADDTSIRHPARDSFTELKSRSRRIEFGLYQLRRLRGESIEIGTILRPLVRPPLRAIARNLRRVEPRTTSARISYGALALMLFYLGAYERMRLTYSSRAAKAATRSLATGAESAAA